jgi:hypothetical protein
MSKVVVFALCLLSAAPAFCAGGRHKVIDSQGNAYSVDAKGAIYTDDSPAPLSGRPHASVENLDYYYNKFGTLLGAGHKEDAIFMGTELLDLPDSAKKVQAIKYAVSLTLARLMAIGELNKNVPFVRHEAGGQVIYRNRQMQFEVGYSSRFEAEDHFSGGPGNMTSAFLGLTVEKPERDERPVTIAVGAHQLKEPFDSYIETTLANSASKRGVEMKPAQAALRAGGRQYRGARKEPKYSYTEETVFLPHPGGKYVYVASFMCEGRKYQKLYGQFAAVVKSLKAGPLPALKYTLETPQMQP